MKPKVPSSGEILYIGEDSGYSSSLKKKIVETYPTDNFDFIELFESDPKNYQLVFLQILERIPNIIYIDLSTRVKEHFELSQLIARENKTKNIPLVGLIESGSLTSKGLFTGLDFIHVKSTELEDVVYDAFYLAFPKKAKKGEFALGKLNRKEILIDDFRIGYITANEIRAEGNIKIEVGELIEIQSYIPTNIVPSKKFIVKSISDNEHYYDYKYVYHFSFVYLETPEIEEFEFNEAECISEEEIVLKKKEKEEAEAKKLMLIEKFEKELAEIKLKLKKWVTKNSGNSSPKKTRVFIFDRILRVLKAKKNLDNLPYAIRIQSRPSDDFQEIYKFRPNIIYYQMGGDDDLDKDIVEEAAVEEELKKVNSIDISRLSGLVKMIKAIDDYSPFLVLFNCKKYSSSAIQDTFKYQQVVTYVDSINLTLMLQMASVYETKRKKDFEEGISKEIKLLKEKDPKKYRKLTVSDMIEKKFYVHKESDYSHVSYSYPIVITSLSESDLTFTTKMEFDSHSFRVNFPVKMAIRIVANGEGAFFENVGEGEKEYKAFIHSAGELDKKEIRKRVNEVFFQDKKEREEQELDAFRALNEKALEEKQKAEKGEDPASDENKDENDKEEKPKDE